MNNIFNNVIRQVTDVDRMMLPKISYSGLDLFRNCNMQYYLKYNEGKRTNETTLALELGSIVHRVLEEKGQDIINHRQSNYDDLNFMLKYGVNEVNEKTKEHLLGTDELKKKYFEEWWEKDDASGKTYNDKLKIFDKVLHEEMEDKSIWTPLATELPFEFVYKDKIIFNGFIDRVDINNRGDYKTIDYKTSKKTYDQKKLATSLQFGIYALAIYYLYGKLPVEFQYRFVLIDETQNAMTKGWEKRLEKTLDGLLDKIKKCKEQDMWCPSPSPLCAWCSYSPTNPKAKEYKDECEYYSLWTPDNRVWDVNKKWNVLDGSDKKDNNKNELDDSKNDKQKRKLIF